LQERPINGRFGMAHLCKIHKFIFEDIYEWAGKPRTFSKAMKKHICQSIVETSRNLVYTNIRW